VSVPFAYRDPNSRPPPDRAAKSAPNPRSEEEHLLNLYYIKFHGAHRSLSLAQRPRLHPSSSLRTLPTFDPGRLNLPKPPRVEAMQMMSPAQTFSDPDCPSRATSTASGFASELHQPSIRGRTPDKLLGSEPTASTEEKRGEKAWRRALGVGQDCIIGGLGQLRRVAGSWLASKERKALDGVW
jgi:hypothetical protein